MLCGGQPVTQEHVIPKWLQRKFGLASQKFTRPSKTQIIYSRLRVPFCQTCNGSRFSGLEKNIANLASAGLGPEHENNRTLHLWLIKIFYGFQIFELQNPTHQNPESTEPDYIAERLRQIHHLQQILRSLMPESAVSIPLLPLASVWIFECSTDWQDDCFALASSPHSNIICLRLGRFAVMAIAGDWGQYHLANALGSSRGAISPIDFYQIFGLLEYFVEKNGLSHSFAMTYGDPDGEVDLVPLAIPAESLDMSVAIEEFLSNHLSR